MTVEFPQVGGFKLFIFSHLLFIYFSGYLFPYDISITICFHSYQVIVFSDPSQFLSLDQMDTLTLTAAGGGAGGVIEHFSSFRSKVTKKLRQSFGQGSSNVGVSDQTIVPTGDHQP